MVDRFLLKAVVFIFLPVLSLTAQEVIDLSKPISKNFTPDRLYWAFDSGTIGQSSPEVVEDLSGNFFEGKLVEGGKHPIPTYIEGRFGTAIRMEGLTPSETLENGDVRTLPNPSVRWNMLSDEPSSDPELLDLDRTSFTAGFWIKVEEMKTEAKPQRIVALQRGMAENSSWIFLLTKSAGESWTLLFGRAPSTESTDVFNDGAWHHVGFSVEVVEGGSMITFWIDGERLGDPVLWDGYVGKPDHNSGRCLSLGEFNVANYSDGMVGAYDDVFITSGVYEFKKP